MNNENSHYSAKSGECSDISFEVKSYCYDDGSDVVTLNCSEIRNNSNFKTGSLRLILWISERPYRGTGWGNNNHQLIQEFDLESLDGGSYFDSFEHDFIAEDLISDIIKEHFLDLELSWCFVITLNELHDNGFWYIVNFVNGQLENEKPILPIADKSVSLIANRSFNGNVKTFSAFSGDKLFMGSLYSKDELFEIQFYNSEFPAVTCYHDNGKVAVEMEYGSDEETLYYNEDGKEINENEFKSMYVGKFEKVLSNAFDELMKKSMSN